MTDDRAGWLREQLAALQAYGNDQGLRATAIREELDVLEAKADRRRRKTKTEEVPQ